MKKLFILAIVVLGFSAVSFGQGKLTATATASVKEAFGIYQGTTVLNFGSFAAVANGKISVAPGATVATFDNVANTSFAGTITSAEFDVSGPSSQAYNITMPTGATTLTSGGNTMTIEAADWTASNDFSGSTDVDGNATFNIGASLTFVADQAPGTYSGTYEVKVNY